MSDLQYTYAVARIRAKEVSLFSQAAIDQLLACQTYEACLHFLQEKGWGDTETPLEAEPILKCEEKKTWDTVRELIKEPAVLDVLDYPKLFHNLKAAVKLVCTEKENLNIFYEGLTPSPEKMISCIKEKNYQGLPPMMSKAAEEAYETLLHLQDGQLCDAIIDKACMEAIYEAGKKAKAPIIRQYAENQVAVGDIKVAVRCAKTGKGPQFIARALAPCASLNMKQLTQAIASGPDGVREYLATAGYAEAAEALSESYSAFERWCDNSVIQTIKPQKYNAFSVGPIVAYGLARDNEIKTVRIILSGKLNGLSDAAIRERVRDMYV